MTSSRRYRASLGRRDGWTSVRARARLTFWGLVAAIAVLALYPRLTLPEPGMTEGVTHSYNHILAFVTLVAVGAFAWGLCRRLVAGLVAYAVTLELAQTLSPGRQTTLADMAASLIGVVIGIVLVRVFTFAMMRLSGRASPDLLPADDNA